MRLYQMRLYQIIHPAPAAALLAIGLLSSFSPAVEAAAMTVCSAQGQCGHAEAIDLDQLANISGKFTVPSEVVGLKVAMNSTWQSPSGQSLAGGANLSVSTPTNGTPQVNYNTNATVTEPACATNCTSADTPSAAVATGGQALQKVNGVGQVVQVAGDGNSAANRTGIDVTSNELGSVAAGSPNASARTANGAESNVVITDKGVAVQLTVPNIGRAQQLISTDVNAGIYQGIQIAANRQVVANQLQLQLQVQPQTAAAAAAEGFGQSLNMLRGR